MKYTDEELDKALDGYKSLIKQQVGDSKFIDLDVGANPPKTEQKIFTQLFEGSDAGSSETVKSRILNKVLKSFILLNETIVLNVEGRLYRKAGKFITIKSDGVLSDGDRLSNLWYTIKVKHIFNAGYYTNEITAVRLFGNTEGAIIAEPTTTNIGVDYDSPPSVIIDGGEDVGSDITPLTQFGPDGLPQRGGGDDVIQTELLGD